MKLYKFFYPFYHLKNLSLYKLSCVLTKCFFTKFLLYIHHCYIYIQNHQSQIIFYFFLISILIQNLMNFQRFCFFKFFLNIYFCYLIYISKLLYIYFIFVHIFYFLLFLFILFDFNLFFSFFYSFYSFILFINIS